jgi:hypothetical protein
LRGGVHLRTRAGIGRRHRREPTELTKPAVRDTSDRHVTTADGETRDAADGVGKGGRARKLRDAAEHGLKPQPFDPTRRETARALLVVS